MPVSAPFDEWLIDLDVAEYRTFLRDSLFEYEGLQIPVQVIWAIVTLQMHLV